MVMVRWQTEGGGREGEGGRGGGERRGSRREGRGCIESVSCERCLMGW